MIFITTYPSMHACYHFWVWTQKIVPRFGVHGLLLLSMSIWDPSRLLYWWIINSLKCRVVVHGKGVLPLFILLPVDWQWDLFPVWRWSLLVLTSMGRSQSYGDSESQETWEQSLSWFFPKRMEGMVVDSACIVSTFVSWV